MRNPVRKAWQYIQLNKLMTIITTVTVAISLSLFSCFVVLSMTIDKASAAIDESSEITAYLDTDTHDNSETLEVDGKEVPNAEYHRIYTAILEIDGVRQAVFSHRDEELEKLKETSDAYEQLDNDDNPLQDIYIISLERNANIDKIANQIDDIAGVDITKYGGQTIKNVLRFARSARTVGLLASIVMGVIAAFLIYNITRLSIYSRRQEIVTMRLVGARDYHIILPFVYEGVITSTVASVVSSIVMSIGYIFIYYNANVAILLNPLNITVAITLLSLVSAIILGAVATSLSVSRYLKI